MKKYNRETLTMCVLEDDRKLSDYAGCYRAHYNKLIFHFSGKIKEVLA